jgi:hypothetical protein
MSVSARLTALVAAAAITAFSFAGPVFAAPHDTAQRAAVSSLKR